jgi:hypothetical protein
MEIQGSGIMPDVMSDRVRSLEEGLGDPQELSVLAEVSDRPSMSDYLPRSSQLKVLPQAAPTVIDTGLAEARGEAVKPVQTAQDIGLLQRLKAECPEILRLIKSPPIRLVGQQRTGKSTFVQKLALLRMILLPAHTVAYATPHAECMLSIPHQLAPFGFKRGQGKDFPAIEGKWREIQESIDRGEIQHQTIVWDEFGSYGRFEDLEALATGLRSLLQEASKHQYYPVLIAHGDQASFYPGVTGILTTLQQSTVKVETIGEAADDFGEMKPTGKIEITWLNGQVDRLQIPDWLTIPYLLSLLPEPKVISDTPVSAQPIAQEDPVAVADEHEATEKLGSPSKDAIAKVKVKLENLLREARGEWMSVNDIIRNSFRTKEDRAIAKAFLERAIALGRLEKQDRTNSNATVSVFVRFSHPSFSNRN